MALNYKAEMMDCVYCDARLEFSPMSDASGQHVLDLILSRSPDLKWDDPKAGEAIEAIPWEGDGVDEGAFLLQFYSDDSSANDLIGRLEDCAIAAQSDAFSFSSPLVSGVLRVTYFCYAEPDGWGEPNDGLDGTEDLDILYGHVKASSEECHVYFDYIPDSFSQTPQPHAKEIVQALNDNDTWWFTDGSYELMHILCSLGGEWKVGARYPIELIVPNCNNIEAYAAERGFDLSSAWAWKKMAYQGGLESDHNKRIALELESVDYD